MKLYNLSEEQIKEIIRQSRFYHSGRGLENVIFNTLKLTPIELPSDEDIEKETWGFRLGRNVAGFISGANWIKQHILNQNK